MSRMIASSSLSDDAVECAIKRAETAMSGKPMICLLVGDHGVGKSTIHFNWAHGGVNPAAIAPNSVQPLHRTPKPNIRVQGTDFLVLDTEGIDTSVTSVVVNPQQQALYSRAAVIVVVYDLSSVESIKRVRMYWLAALLAYDVKCPVVFCGNKIDLTRKPYPRDQELETTNLIRSLHDMSSMLSTSLTQISGLKFAHSAHELFGRAQGMVVYPFEPLFRKKVVWTGKTSEEDVFLDDVIIALRDCFAQIDKDGDKYLNDDEVIDLHKDVFHTDLDRAKLQALKRDLNGVRRGTFSPRGMAFRGLLFMLQLNCSSGNAGIAWKVLNAGGYDYHIKKVRVGLRETDIKPVEEEEKKE